MTVFEQGSQWLLREDMEGTHGGQAFGQLRDGASMGLVYHEREICVVLQR